jgi:hypothetical protein
MRTTVRLDDQLLRRAKQYALAHGETLTAVLERALRELLARREAPKPIKRLELVTFKGRGIRAGVDLDDSASLMDVMEHDDGAR